MYTKILVYVNINANILETTRQRILQFIDNQKIEPKDFLAKTNLKRGVLDKSHLEKGISDVFVSKILESYTNISARWLLTGKGEMLKTDTIKPTIQNNRPSIPLLPADAIAGMSDGSVSIREKDIQEFYTIPDFEDVDFMIRVKGSSMYPKYNSGDIIACRFLEGSRFIQWNKVYVLATQYQGILVKRLKPSDNEDCFTAISDNEKYDPFDIPKSEITNIALVIGVIRLE